MRPTASLSTTAALAISVGVAVPVFGMRSQGFAAYLKHLPEPTAIMLPFHLLSETSRNLALAVRLFGNMMSGAMIAGMLLAIAPFFFPVPMQMLALLTGMIQAYIFAILAMVYIAAAVQQQDRKDNEYGQSNHDRHRLDCRRRRSAWRIGAIGPALGEGKAIAQALAAIAQQPDESAPSAALC